MPKVGSSPAIIGSWLPSYIGIVIYHNIKKKKSKRAHGEIYVLRINVVTIQVKVPSIGWGGGVGWVGGWRRIKKPALWTSENLNLNSEREPLVAPVNAISMTTVTCLREFPCPPQSCQHHHDDTSTSEISELHLQGPTAECIESTWSTKFPVIHGAESF